MNEDIFASRIKALTSRVKIQNTPVAIKIHNELVFFFNSVEEGIELRLR